MKKQIFIVALSLCSTISVFSQWTTSGTNVTTTGNVGIGTTTPAAKLDVNGDIRANNLLLYPTRQLTAAPNEIFQYDNQNFGHYSVGWMRDSWSSAGPTLWQSGYGGIKFFTSGKARVGINNVGNVGIGTDNPVHQLDVNGNIRGHKLYVNEVKIEVQTWSNFVFDKDYKLPTLTEVKSHIEEHKHLPDVPSEKQVLEEGLSVGEMQAKLLQKIEELTLYVIKQDEEIQKLKESLSKE